MSLTAIPPRAAYEARAKQQWLQRVIAERADLDDRLTRLTNFIAENHDFRKLSDVERGLLREQCKVMSDYSDILLQRIKAATPADTPMAVFRRNARATEADPMAQGYETAALPVARLHEGIPPFDGEQQLQFMTRRELDVTWPGATLL